MSGVLFVRIRTRPSADAINLGKNLTAVGCFVLLLLVAEGRAWPTDLPLHAFLLLAGSGLLGLALCDAILFRAFLQIGPRRSNVFTTLSPALVMTMAALPPLSEHPPLMVWLGMCVCLFGIALAALERPTDPAGRALLRRGVRNALIAAVLQAIAMLLAREGHRNSDVSVAAASTVRLAFGAGGLIVYGAMTGRLRGWGRELSAGRGRTMAQLALAGFLASFLGIWTNQAGLVWSTHAGVAATLNALAPVFLIPLSAVFLAERHDWRAWVSAVLAVGGIALMTWT